MKSSVTGRLTHNEPEMQHLPGTPSDILQRLHQKGMTKLIDVDYSEIELRVVALMAENLHGRKRTDD